MDEAQRAALLGGFGLRTEALGPAAEWAPVDPATYQQRHTAYWGVITDLVEDEPGDYDDLPSWMTEDGSDQLEANN